MSWLWRIAERAIEKARDAGDLDDLPGAGKPLPRETLSSGLDPVEEAGYRIMKQEGAVPPEVALMQKAAAQRAHLAGLTDEAERRAAMKDLSETQMRLSMMMERRRGLRW